jgi:hypothetical protein
MDNLDLRRRLRGIESRSAHGLEPAHLPHGQGFPLPRAMRIAIHQCWHHEHENGKSMTTAALVGTLDTKQEEYQWLREQRATTGCDSITIDVGTFSDGGGIADINSAEVATAGGADRDELRAANDRGAAMTAMGVGVAAVVRQLHAADRIDGLLAVGGSSGSSVAARALQALVVAPFQVVMAAERTTLCRRAAARLAVGCQCLLRGGPRRCRPCAESSPLPLTWRVAAAAADEASSSLGAACDKSPIDRQSSIRVALLEA